MLYREIFAVCSQIHTKHINIVSGQNVELLNVKLMVHRVTTGLWWVKLSYHRGGRVIILSGFTLFTLSLITVLLHIIINEDRWDKEAAHYLSLWQHISRCCVQLSVTLLHTLKCPSNTWQFTVNCLLVRK